MVGFEPKFEKQRAVLCSSKRKNIVVGGIGASKSYLAAYFGVPRFLDKPKRGAEKTPRYWLVGENYGLPQTEFNYVRDALAQIPGLVVTKHNEPSEGSWILEIEGVCRIETKSWTNPNQLHAKPVQGMIIVEAGLLPANIWYNNLLNRLGRVPGHWFIMAGTLEESERFFRDLATSVILEESKPDWFGQSIATWDNIVTYPGGYEDPTIQELRASMPADVFDERYGAIPRKPAALVYREFSQAHHVGNHKFDKHRPVYLWIDPTGVYAVNAVQQHGGDFYIIDEIHIEPGTSEKAIEAATKKKWWRNVKYGVIDATQTEARAVWEGGAIWKVLDATPVPVNYKKVPVEPGIELVRSTLHSARYDRQKTPEEDIWSFEGRAGVSRLHVDSKCEHTIREFSQAYKRKKLLSGQYSPDEVVKRDDHHMDAIRYGLAHMLGFTAPVTAAGRRRQRTPWYDPRPVEVW